MREAFNLRANHSLDRSLSKGVKVKHVFNLILIQSVACRMLRTKSLQVSIFVRECVRVFSLAFSTSSKISANSKEVCSVESLGRNREGIIHELLEMKQKVPGKNMAFLVYKLIFNLV